MGESKQGRPLKIAMYVAGLFAVILVGYLLLALVLVLLGVWGGA